MSANSSNSATKHHDKEHAIQHAESDPTSPVKRQYRWIMLAALPVWVALGFVLANVIIVVLFWLCNILGLDLTALVNSAVLQTITACLVYFLTFVIVVGVPYLVRQQVIDLKLIGLQRLPLWSDIGLAPLGFIVYALLSALLTYLATQLFPHLPLDQAQDVGFKALGRQYEYTLAFITLVALAPLAEESLFRGYLFGKLQTYVPMIPALIVTSLLFGVAHLPGGDHIQWSVALDTFALSIVLCLLRVITGSIWAGVLLHMTKNAIAFYLVFVNPFLMMGAS
jgi:hypothetical protein